jgi:hypothetical protein
VRRRPLDVSTRSLEARRAAGRRTCASLQTPRAHSMERAERSGGDVATVLLTVT